MKKLFSLICICAATVSLHAELVYKTGYIVLNTGDSVKGDIRVNTKKELPLYQKVAIKIGESTKTYKPDQVKEFAFENVKFISRRVGGEMQFVKILVAGRINVYELQYEMQRGNEMIVESEYYIERNDGGTSEPEKLKTAKFKKTVSELMADNAELVARVQADDKKYEIADIQNVVTEYNTWYAQNNGTLTGAR